VGRGRMTVGVVRPGCRPRRPPVTEDGP
jgi:hypothetical protein